MPKPGRARGRQKWPCLPGLFPVCQQVLVGVPCVCPGCVEPAVGMNGAWGGTAVWCWLSAPCGQPPLLPHPRLGKGPPCSAWLTSAGLCGPSWCPDSLYQIRMLWSLFMPLLWVQSKPGAQNSGTATGPALLRSESSGPGSEVTYWIRGLTSPPRITWGE